jgi:hypothetical protein
MRVIEHPFSDLLRQPKKVTDDVEDGDVVLRRRDEPDLRLSRADREAQRADTFTALGRVLRNLAVHNAAALSDALGDAFPWVELLPPTDRREFIDEFSRVLMAVAEVDNYDPLSQLVHEWRSTAEIHADPKLARGLRRSLDVSGERIPAPEG